MLGRYKKIIEAKLRGLAKAAAVSGVSPNALTLSGLLIGLAGLYPLYAYGCVPCFLLAAALMAFMDMLDGLVARYTGKASKFGAFLDSTVDRAEDAVLVAALMLSSVLTPAEGLTLLTGMFLISYARARAEGLGLHMSGVGLAERPERLLLILAALAAYPVSFEAARIIALGLLGIVYLTVAQRIAYAWRMLR